jgi:phosphate starvation-inducible protein PhoH and related proteins
MTRDAVRAEGTIPSPGRGGVGSHLSSMPEVRSLDVELPQRCVEILLSGSDAPGRRIELAVRPYHLDINPQYGAVRLAGDEVAVTLAAKMMEPIGAAMRATGRADEALIRDTAAAVIRSALKHELSYNLAGLRGALHPMSLSQAAFMNTMLLGQRSLIFGIGPTGTGKTHLAIAAGLNLVAESRFKSLVITRPHVRLEGEVMTPELRAETAYDEQLTPIEDELHALIGRDDTRRRMDQGLIEIMPLGRMRGRTFNETFVVVDEAQNMTVRKMRMAVTRLGRGSRMVVTGDPVQDDLPNGETSGLTHLLGMIAGTDLAVVHQFQNIEIIRNDLVARIETLYSREDGVDIRAAA